MKNEYLLTVIVPVYNASSTICRCLDSIVNQSFKSIKIIVIDDGSTDDSLAIITKYKSQYHQIYCYQTERQSGPGVTRNMGLEYTDTKYVTFLDSDDWVDFNAYYDAINLLEENLNSDIAIFGIKTEYNTIGLSTLRYKYKYTNIINSDFALTLLSKCYEQSEYISPLLGCKIYRTQLLIDYKINFTNGYFEDNAFAFITILHTKNIILIPDCFLHYYQNQTSITHTFSKRHIDDFFVSMKYMLIYLNKINKYDEFKLMYFSFFDKCCKFLLNTMFQAEQEVHIQKKYISYFWNQFLINIPIEEYLNYFDINLIRKLL